MQLFQASFKHEFNKHECKMMFPPQQRKLFTSEENARKWVQSQVKRLEQIVLMLHRECPDLWPEVKVIHEKHEQWIRYIVASRNPYKRMEPKKLRCRATSHMKIVKTDD